MAASINGRAERLRELLGGSRIVEMPGCYDALTAMVLEKVGFQAAFLSGYGVAASMLGNPDIGLTTLTETATVAKNVVNALGIPLVVDADNGYGDSDSVMRAVYELEHAGAAGMILEDQVMPKKCGHTGGKKVIPLEQFLTKLECALKCRQTPLVIVARTDSTDLDDAIARASAFQSAGADVCVIDGLPSIAAAERFAAAVSGPKLINLVHGGKTPLLPARQLEELGFKVLLYSTPALYVSMHSLMNRMATLRETGDLNSITDASVKLDAFQKFIEERYLSRRRVR